MRTNGTVSKPRVGESVQATLNLDKAAPPAPDHRPDAYIVTPPAAGNKALTVRPTEATAVVNIRNENGSWNYPLELKKFSYSPPKFLAARNRNRWKHYNDLLEHRAANWCKNCARDGEG
jgi:hypothetical protein